MNIKSRTQALNAVRPMDSAHFTGRARSLELLQPPKSAMSPFVALVQFEAGVRNHWHSHPGGQLLYVVQGEGWVQVRGGDPRRIREHDIVSTEANEEHWHGASRSRPMAHIAFGIGETRWLEESPSPPE
jgi:quercetin dioxygenase-like cupin family protein